jgi:hypothetical protein
MTRWVTLPMDHLAGTAGTVTAMTETSSRVMTRASSRLRGVFFGADCGSFGQEQGRRGGDDVCVCETKGDGHLDAWTELREWDLEVMRGFDL